MKTSSILFKLCILCGIITHSGNSQCVNRVNNGICNCASVCVHALKKWLELSTPNLLWLLRFYTFLIFCINSRNIWTRWYHCHSLTPVNPDWFTVLVPARRLTEVVPDKWPLNGSSSSNSRNIFWWQKLVGHYISPIIESYMLHSNWPTLSLSTKSINQ